VGRSYGGDPYGGSSNINDGYFSLLLANDDLSYIPYPNYIMIITFRSRFYYNIVDMFIYNSTQTHSEFKRGVGQTKTKRVTVRGKTGYKMVTIRGRGGRVTKKSKKRLTQSEIKCIKRCQFIPGLFKDCEKCVV